MEKDEKAVDTGTAAPDSTLSAEDDAEARFAALTAERDKALEEAANYKLGMLKAKAKADPDETDDERMRRIAADAVADSRLAEIAREQDAIIKRALKENKELKLAKLSEKKDPSGSMGTHSEGTQVTDTLVTPEQLAAFKARGWTDKDIERYKKNYQKYSPGIGGR